MTFGEKLRKLRTDNNLTQDELAEKIFVTRTAISKWETDKGYPSIESLKQLSGLFKITVDDLISDEDIENKRILDEAQSRKYYWCAMACLAVTTVLAVVSYFTQVRQLYFLSTIGVIGYVIFGLLSKPNYKRMHRRRMLIVPLIISRLVIAAVIIIVIVYGFMRA